MWSTDIWRLMLNPLSTIACPWLKTRRTLTTPQRFEHEVRNFKIFQKTCIQTDGMSQTIEGSVFPPAAALYTQRALNLVDVRSTG